MKVHGQSDCGLVRKNNEDSFVLLPNLYGGVGMILADGMGGHNRGELASSVAVKFAAKKMKDKLHAHLSYKEIGKRMTDIVEHANVTVYLESLLSPQNAGMGTTLTLAYQKDDELIISHVGDCRVYRLSQQDSCFERLTTDHTLGQELVNQGALTAEEAIHHQGRHMLTRALGVPDYISADVYAYKLKKGDRILMCTDGLYGYVDEREIKLLLNHQSTPEACCEACIEAANRKGGGDNITVLVGFVD